MKNEIKNIVCNHRSSYVVDNIEKFIENKLKEGWSIEVIYDSMITALQNKLQEYNY